MHCAMHISAGVGTGLRTGQPTVGKGYAGLAANYPEGCEVEWWSTPAEQIEYYTERYRSLLKQAENECPPPIRIENPDSGAG